MLFIVYILNIIYILACYKQSVVDLKLLSTRTDRFAVSSTNTIISSSLINVCEYFSFVLVLVFMVFLPDLLLMKYMEGNLKF